MATSGTFAFAPEVVDVLDEAFERCGVDPALIGERHLRSSRMSLNLLLIEWANRRVTLYAIDEQTQTLTDGDLDYTAASGTIAILEGVIRRSGSDTPVARIGRAQYHAIPNKTQEGLPTNVYYDRSSGIYRLWQGPENSTDVFRYYRLRRHQDVGTNLSQNADANYLWTDALCAGLAARLALKFAPARLDALERQSEKAFILANGEDRERADVEMEPT